MGDKFIIDLVNSIGYGSRLAIFGLGMLSMLLIIGVIFGYPITVAISLFGMVSSVGNLYMDYKN